MKYKFIQTLLLVLFPIFLTAQVDRSTPPEPGPAPLIRIGDYQYFELKNGLKVFVVENHKIPRVTYSLVLNIDPFTESDSAGYSSIAGSLLGTATTSRTKDQIDEEIDFIGATLNTSAGSIFGAALKKHNEKLLELMSDILLNPVFNQDELDKLKKQTISGLAFNKTDPSAISGVVSNVLLYGKSHPYGEVTTEASVNSVDLDMCREYYNSYFRPNIAYLAIVGDIDLKEAKKLIKKYFGQWDPGSVPEHVYPTPEAPANLQVSIVDRPHAVQSVIRVAYPINYTIGMKGYQAARVMNLMLGGTFARLDKNLREDHAYTYGVNSTLSQDKWIGNFSVSTDVRNEVTDSAVYQILYEMRKIRDDPASQEEVDKIKNYMSGTFALALERPSTVAQFAINIVRYNLPSDYYVNYLKAVAAVTPQDVQAAAKKYIKPENCYILVVGKADEIATKLSRFSPDSKIKYFDTEGNLLDPAEMVKAIPAGLTAEDVIEKFLAASGGRSRLESIKNIRVKMSLEMQGMKLESEILRKAPDKFSMTMSMGGNVLTKTSYDGTSGKITGMKGEQELEGEDLEALRFESLFMPELDFSAAGYTLKLISVQNTEEGDAYQVEFIDSAGNVSSVCYSVDTGYKVKEEKTQDSPQGPITQSTIFSDYRDVEGYMYPHKMTIIIGSQIISATVESVILNSGIEDSSFR